MVPKIRIQSCNNAPVNKNGGYVLYWMIANRRVKWNFSLERAVEWARKLNKPLVVLEALRCDYRWASDRLHRFVLDGMVENARQLADTNVHYFPYIEPKKGHGKGLLARLGQYACMVVTDDFPAFFLPKMIESAAKQLNVKLEKVDSNGLLPLRAAPQVFYRAYDFRRFLHKHLIEHLDSFPKAQPLIGFPIPTLNELPDGTEHRWPKATDDLLQGNMKQLSKLPIDHTVQPVKFPGGTTAAEKRLHGFLNENLPDYAEHRNEPEKEVTSGLSPYLHFGHISVHQIFSELAEREDWSISMLSDNTSGKRVGWWGMSKNAESFLDELITWRELGYNLCWQNNNYDRYDSLPDWALKTLAEHADDPRENIYTLEEFERAETHDLLWNAAQKQLLQEGRIHNYLRMLWGKKIVHWTAKPQDALKIMIELNNKYALDGRNPNSYSGIFWVLGRYDRPWGPERAIFGKVRYMSSENTVRKLQVQNYIEKYSG